MHTTIVAATSAAANLSNNGAGLSSFSTVKPAKAAKTYMAKINI